MSENRERIGVFVENFLVADFEALCEKQGLIIGKKEKAALGITVFVNDLNAAQAYKLGKAFGLLRQEKRFTKP